MPTYDLTELVYSMAVDLVIRERAAHVRAARRVLYEMRVLLAICGGLFAAMAFDVISENFFQPLVLTALYAIATVTTARRVVMPMDVALHMGILGACAAVALFFAWHAIGPNLLGPSASGFMGFMEELRAAGSSTIHDMWPPSSPTTTDTTTSTAY